MTFKETAALFAENFKTGSFPKTPATLYEPIDHFLQIGGKRIRPVLCLMGNELFDDIRKDAFHVATAIELFHNFTLIHDDMMDKAPLRRGIMTVHEKYGNNTALLAGDVMMIAAYEHLNKIDPQLLPSILNVFNRTAKEVCEGQQYDMDFETQEHVTLEEYLKMIELKTSVLLAASLEMGALIGGASKGNREHLYAFGRDLGIAFQIQDDHLDAFGDPGKFGKDVGGDIKQNKKTFLLIHALNTCSETQKRELYQLMKDDPADKVEKVLSIFKACNVDQWAQELKNKYLEQAFQHLESIAVVSSRKRPLQELAEFLVQRDH